MGVYFLSQMLPSFRGAMKNLARPMFEYPQLQRTGALLTIIFAISSPIMCDVVTHNGAVQQSLSQTEIFPTLLCKKLALFTGASAFFVYTAPVMIIQRQGYVAIFKSMFTWTRGVVSDGVDCGQP